MRNTRILVFVVTAFANVWLTTEVLTLTKISFWKVGLCMGIWVATALLADAVLQLRWLTDAQHPHYRRLDRD